MFKFFKKWLKIIFQTTEVTAMAIPNEPVTSIGTSKIKLNAIAMMTNRITS
jgi:hypothetical protein